MLKLGRAQGVAIAAAMRHGLDVTEYSPKKIKQSITGNGNATKEQVLKMLQRIVPFKEAPKYLDASDALATAVCHYFQESKITVASSTSTKATPKKKAKPGTWDDFIKKNPERIIKK